jgi:hypothetical protein
MSQISPLAISLYTCTEMIVRGFAGVIIMKRYRKTSGKEIQSNVFLYPCLSEQRYRLEDAIQQIKYDVTYPISQLETRYKVISPNSKK